MSPEKMQQYKGEIQECRILEDLSAEEIEALGQFVWFKEFPSGDDILTEGHNYQGLWLILRGQCDVIKDCGEAESNLATLQEGCLFGEMSFFEDVPHSATVRATQPTEVVCMTREEFEKFRKEHPATTEKIVINIVKLMSDRLRQMDQWTCRLVENEVNTQKHQEWHEFRARLYSNLFD